jgi:hypothetical protein
MRGGFFGDVDAEAAGAAAVVVDALAQLFNLFGAHARQAGQAAGSMASASWSMLEILAASQSRATVLGPMPGSLSSSRTPGAVFGKQLVAQGQRAGGGDGLQIGGHALADAGNLQQAGGVGAAATSPQPDYCIRLGAFLTLDDVELNVIALFQRFVSVQLNR